MDILSQKTLTLLRNENVRKTIDDLIDQRATDSKTVDVKPAQEGRPAARRAVRVRIRRIA